MSQENSNFFRDLIQIAETQRTSADALESIAGNAPDYADDLREMRETSLKIAADLEAIAKRTRNNFDEENQRPNTEDK